MASLQRTEIFANTDPEADYLFGLDYENTSLNPRRNNDGEAVPFTAVVARACPVGGHVMVTDLAGLRAHMYSKHKITVPGLVSRPRAFSWA